MKRTSGGGEREFVSSSGERFKLSLDGQHVQPKMGRKSALKHTTEEETDLGVVARDAENEVGEVAARDSRGSLFDPKVTFASQKGWAA